MSEQLIGQQSPEQIAEWKKQHGEVFALKVDGHICYLKEPNRGTVGAAAQAATQNPIKFGEVILRGCWLGGAEEIRTRDDLFLAANSQLANIVNIKEAELEKL